MSLLAQRRAELEGVVEEGQTLAAEDVPEEQRAEHVQKLTRITARVTALKEEIRALEQIEAMDRNNAVREDISPGRTPANPSKPSLSMERDLTPPSERALFDQHMTFVRSQHGQDVGDEGQAEIFRMSAVERLLGRVLLAESASRARNTLTPEEREAWDAFQQHRARVEQAVMQRDFNVGASAEGGSFVPTALEAMIFGARQYAGALATDELVRVYRSPVYANLDVPTMAIFVADEKAENTDSTSQTSATGTVNFQPVDIDVFVEATEAIMMAPVNFEAHVGPEAGRAFGRYYNRERLRGPGGAGRFTGAFTETASAANRRTVATSSAVTKTDLIALFRLLLDWSNFEHPSFRVLIHPTALWSLYEAVQSGTDNALFALPRTGRLVMPETLPYSVNGGLQPLDGTAGNKVIGIGDFSRYGVYYAGGMRVAMDYNVKKGVYEMSMRQWTDGAPLDTSSFRRIEDKA